MLALQAAQQVHNLRAHAHIQRRNRLIQNQQPGPERQRAGDVDALPLPATEFMRVAFERRFIQAHLAQEFDRLGAQGGAAGLDPGLAAMDEQRLGHNLQHIHARIEGCVRVLKDGLHLAAQAVQLHPRSTGHVDSVYAHAALAGRDQPQNHPCQRGLARTGLAHQPQRLPGLDGERHVLDDCYLFGPQPDPAGIALRYRVDLNQRHAQMVHGRRTAHCI